jgi:hypothetical protein
MQISSNATDITKYVDWKSLDIENNLTSQIDLCSFKYKKYGTRAYTPVLGHVVIITDDAGVRIFAGKITKMTKKVEGYEVLNYEIDCMDYTIDLNAELVPASYSDESVEDIINAIITDYTTGFTTVNVNCTELVNFISFNYETISKCIQRLAEMFGYEWYIDYAQDIHFFARGDEAAPFDLADTTGNYTYRSLTLKENYESIKNAVIVRGSSYTGESIVTRQTKITEGEETCDTVERFGEEPRVYINGTEQTVGLDHIDDPNSYDCLWNYGQKLVRWRADNLPSLFDKIEIKGRPEIPIILEVADAASIATYGRREFEIMDKTIKTKESANDRAAAELQAYKDKLEEGSFTTYRGGLRAGQQITVGSVVRGINTDFIIKSVITRLRSPHSFVYSVSLVTQRTLGIIEFLQNQIKKGERTVGQPTDEVVARFVDFFETITLVEATTQKLGMHSGIDFLWGTYTPTNFITLAADPLDRKRAARYDASCTWE